MTIQATQTQSLVLPIAGAWLFFLPLAVELFIADNLLNIGNMLTSVTYTYSDKGVKTICFVIHHMRYENVCLKILF